MPTVSQNQDHWGKEYSWPEQGDEWSAPWGGAFNQWHWSIRPRIASFLPAACILELAPGFGRWSQFLIRECDSYLGIDLNPKCVEACQQRFGNSTHAKFYQNDGRSLDMVPDASVDFVFSFDSLVHVESDVVGDYLRQLARKLKPTGVGFIHHSNIGAYRRRWAWKNRLVPAFLRKFLTKHGRMQHYQWRAFSMDNSKMKVLCGQEGLLCATQEVINWRGPLLIDCLTIFGREDARLNVMSTPFRNALFMDEAKRICGLGALYGKPISKGLK